MRLRQAIKICREVYELSKLKERIRKNRTWECVQEAKRVCRKRWSDERIPYIPSEEEEYERAEMFGCFLLDFAKEMGAPEDEIEEAKIKFLVKLHESKPNDF